MRKYQPDKLKEIITSYEAYGPVIQTLALLNEGWEPGQILKYYVESHNGIIAPKKELPEIKIKRVTITRRNYQKVKCPFCSMVSTPGAVSSHISFRHPEKKLLAEEIVLSPPPEKESRSHSEETKQKMRETHQKNKEKFLKELSFLYRPNTSISESS
jgi:hypothetical protein